MSRWRRAVLAVGVLIILGGLLGLAYPAVGSFINSMTHRRAVMAYRQEAEALPDEDVSRMLKEAAEYNEWICGRGEAITGLNEEELKKYERLLAVSVTGIMGYIEIPKIKVVLPIYHGTREEVLQVGVGHLAGSSLPIGGENTHAVLTGHSGLPSSRIFTDLDQLAYGDTFTITVLGHSAVYAVDQIEVVEPDEAEHQTIAEGKDYCTLVTCTPIGVNSHRLVVRGQRMPDSKTEAEAKQPQTEGAAASDETRAGYPDVTALLSVCTALGAILVLLLVLLIRRKKRGGKR